MAKEEDLCKALRIKAVQASRVSKDFIMKYWQEVRKKSKRKM